MISVGDKITIISQHNNVLSVDVAAVFNGGSFRAVTSWQYEEIHALYDEGITWIRGWHDENSPEVAALRSAKALSRNDAWDFMTLEGDTDNPDESRAWVFHISEP